MNWLISSKDIISLKFCKTIENKGFFFFQFARLYFKNQYLGVLAHFAYSHHWNLREKGLTPEYPMHLTVLGLGLGLGSQLGLGLELRLGLGLGLGLGIRD